MKKRLIMMVLLLAGCSREELPSDAKDATREIRQWVPIGTSAAEARRIMEQHQFKCSPVSNDAFTTSGGTVQSGLDHLYCDRVSFKSPLEHRWQAALVLKDDKVSDIHVSFGLTGP